MSDRDDYLALLRGEITSEEYVERLRGGLRPTRGPVGGRFYLRQRLRHPQDAYRAGFWDGVRSIFRWR